MEMFKLYQDILSESDMALLKNVLEQFKEFMNLKEAGDLEDLKGHKFMTGFSPEVTEFAYNNFQPRKGDVYLFSYAKTGTHWGMEVLQQILFEDKRDSKLHNSFPLLIRMIEKKPCDKFALFDKLPLKRRLFFSHLPSEFVNVEKIVQVDAKIIYILRNPKDQIVSWYKFAQKIPQGKFEPIKSMIDSGWEHYLDKVLEGAFPMISKPGEWYPEHILSWYQHMDKKQVLFVFYEDMLKDLGGQIKSFAQFLDVPLTEERVAAIAEACAFDNMKKEKTASKSMNSQVLGMIMRKGGVGGWKDYFTVSQSERVDAIIEEKLKDTNIKFTYQL